MINLDTFALMSRLLLTTVLMSDSPHHGSVLKMISSPLPRSQEELLMQTLYSFFMLDQIEEKI